MSITIEHYLTASLTLFNDLILTVPRYILWELIFTSRWIWLSLHIFSAIYSIFVIWGICTFYLLRLPDFISTFFFVAGGLSFIRFFGKNQNRFFFSSQISTGKCGCNFDINLDNIQRLNYFELINHFFFCGGTGNLKGAFILTILTLLISSPIYIIGINIPGVSGFYKLIYRFFGFNGYFKLSGSFNFHSNSIYSFFTSFSVVMFYWYCIELQSLNFRNLTSINPNGFFIIEDKSPKDNILNRKFASSDYFLRFITTLEKKYIFLKQNSKFLSKVKVLYLTLPLFTIPSIIPLLYFIVLYYQIFWICSSSKTNKKNSNSIFEEWCEYERGLFYLLDKLQKQLESIFSVVLLLDSSVHTKVAALKNTELQMLVQSSLGFERTFSLLQVNSDDWLFHAFSSNIQVAKKSHIPRSINLWWHWNILLSDSLNIPKIKTQNKRAPSDWNASKPILYHRSEVFCMLLERFRTYYKREATIKYAGEGEANKPDDEITSQLLFLMQELTLYAVDLCCLHVYCYHRFIKKNFIINKARGELNMQAINQFISLSVEVKNRIYFAREIGLLSSPYLHPIFEQELTRLYRGIEDSLELLLQSI
ncbi:9 transmembrane domain protein [Cryptosporidium felis]|nr:9 transmembrane domain protein [Cryptosporidium felis]